jgi:hypothetical protein
MRRRANQCSDRFSIQGFTFRVYGLGSRVGVQGLGFRDEGLGFRVWGWGLGLRVWFVRGAVFLFF